MPNKVAWNGKWAFLVVSIYLTRWHCYTTQEVSLHTIRFERRVYFVVLGWQGQVITSHRIGYQGQVEVIISYNICVGCNYLSLPLIPVFGTQVFNCVAYSRRWTPKHFNQKYFYRRRQISITTKLQNTLYTSACWTFVNTYHNMESAAWKCSKSVHNMFIWHCHKLGAVSIRKTVLPGMAIPMLKIRRPNGRLIFNMGIAIHR